MNNSQKTPSLENVLRKINESVDDFLSKPAQTASDKGAFDDYPLHKVAIWGDVIAAKVLLKNGASPNVAGEDGDTPLHRAIAGGHREMVKFLLENGANPKIRNRHGSTALDDAKSLNRFDLIEAFKI